MSEVQLLVRAQRLGPPRALILVHVLAFLATIGILVLWIGPSPSGGYTRALFLGAIFGWVPGLMVVLTLLGGFEVRYGPQIYTDELLRRAGWIPFSQLTAEARERSSADGDRGWLLLFCGRAVPHGGSHFVQVRLYEDEEQVCPVEYGDLRWPLTDNLRSDPRRRVHLGDGRLLPDEWEELWDLLRGTERDPLTGWPTDETQGYPFELLAVRQGDGASFEYAGNLADANAPSRGRRLAAMLLDIGQRAGADRCRYGIIQDGRLVFVER